MHERIFQENLEIQEKNLQICLESPYALLKFIATQRVFVGKKDIEDEAYKRTEGTSVEAKLLLERVEDWLKNLPQDDPVLFGSLKENTAFKSQGQLSDKTFIKNFIPSKKRGLFFPICRV